MSYIHVPKSEANEFAQILWGIAGNQFGRRIGVYVAHHVYETVKQHIQQNRYDHIELQNANSPTGYVLLAHKDENYR